MGGGGPGRGKGRGNHNQDILCKKKNLFSIKGKKNLVLVELDPKEF